MSEFLQKYPLTPGTPVQIDSSKSASIAYDFINNSPYDVDIAWGLSKPESFSIPPTTIWRGASPLSALLIPGNQWTGIIIATPSNPLGGTPPANLSAAQLTVTGYAKGAEPTEQVTTLNTQTTIGGGALSQATSVVQTGNPAPTAVVSATPSASFLGATQETIINNDGSANFGKLIPGQKITFDTSGNLKAASLTDTGGSFQGTAPVKLTTGNQETGKTGSLQYAVAGTVVGTETNFKTVMTNVPSSITITVAIQTNDSSAGFADVDVYGFALLFTVVSTGQGQWRGNYTTVGN